jgi:hypothetical protein
MKLLQFLGFAVSGVMLVFGVAWALASLGTPEPAPVPKWMQPGSAAAVATDGAVPPKLPEPIKPAPAADTKPAVAGDTEKPRPEPVAAGEPNPVAEAKAAAEASATGEPKPGAPKSIEPTIPATANCQSGCSEPSSHPSTDQTRPANVQAATQAAPGSAQTPSRAVPAMQATGQGGSIAFTAAPRQSDKPQATPVPPAEVPEPSAEGKHHKLARHSDRRQRGPEPHNSQFSWTRLKQDFAKLFHPDTSR